MLLGLNKIDFNYLLLVNYINKQQTNKQTKQTNKMSMTLEIVAARVEVLEKQMAALMADKTEPDENKVKKEKKTKKEKKAKGSDDDEPKKKRAPTGYLVFSSAMREEVKAALAGDDDEKVKPQAVTTELGARWKALEQEERDEWNAKAKAMAAA